MGKLRSTAAGLYLCIVAIGLASVPAQATLIDNGAVTFDTDTGLEWLDLTESAGFSYNGVAEQFGAGGLFDGWRHATTAEVTALFAYLDFAPPYSSAPASPKMLSAVTLLGGHQIMTDQIFAGGFFDDGTAGNVGVAYLYHNVSSYPHPIDQDNSLVMVNFSSGDATGGSTYGNWLVREAAEISEPSSLAVLALGLVGFGYARRPIGGKRA